jgi:hypothetical protein
MRTGDFDPGQLTCGVYRQEPAAAPGWSTAGIKWTDKIQQVPGFLKEAASSLHPQNNFKNNALIYCLPMRCCFLLRGKPRIVTVQN